MAFISKQFNDLRGILILMLLTIPSIATTNIDCNGKPFHCVNSTHFMICVDLGSGISSTIDSFIIPCPSPTECRGTNRFECEFPAPDPEPLTNEPVVFSTERATITDQFTTILTTESTVQFVPEIVTTIPFEDLYNTVSPTTLSEISVNTQNPTVKIDSTTNAFDSSYVTTSGIQVDKEAGGRNTDALKITNLTQDVLPETTASPMLSDSTVVNTTENSNIYTINEINTLTPELTIITTEQNTIAPIITTERVDVIVENNTVTGTVLIEAITTEGVNIVNNATPITATRSDQLNAENIQKIVKDTETVVNPLENVLLNVEKTTASTDIPIAISTATIQLSQVYETTETAVTSISNKDDLSLSEQIGFKTLAESNFLVDQEKPQPSVNNGTFDKNLPTPNTNFELSIQEPNATNNLDNVSTIDMTGNVNVNDNDVLLGPSSELNNAVVPSTTPLIDTTLFTETINTHDGFYLVKTIGVISTTKVNVPTDITATFDNKENIVDKVSNIPLIKTNLPVLNTDGKILSTESPIAEIMQTETVLPLLETTLTENVLALTRTQNIININSVTEPTISVTESNINFISNVDTPSTNLEQTFQHLEVSEQQLKPENPTNVTELNISSNIDLNADKRDKKILKETITEKNKYINTEIQFKNNNNIFVEVSTPEIITTQTTENSNNIASYSDNFEPNIVSLPVLSTKDLSYQETSTSETPIKGSLDQSTLANSYILNSENVMSSKDTVSSILPTDVTEPNKMADQLYTEANIDKDTHIVSQKPLALDKDKSVTSEVLNIEPTEYKQLLAQRNEQTLTQVKQNVGDNTLQTTDGKILSTESTSLDNKQMNIKLTFIDTTSSENILTVITTASTPELKLTRTDSAVTDSNLLFESNFNNLPKELSSKDFDFNNEQNQLANKITLKEMETKGFTTTAPRTEEIIIQLKEKVAINTQQETTSVPSFGTTTNIAESDANIQLPITKFTENYFNNGVPSVTILPDSILRQTTSTIENTGKLNLVPKLLESTDFTTKNIVKINPHYKITEYDTKYTTGETNAASGSTVTITDNLDNNAQVMKSDTSQNQFLNPNVKIKDATQYNSDVNWSGGPVTLQQPNDIMKIKQFILENKNNLAKNDEIIEAKTPIYNNIVTKITDSSVPISVDKNSLKNEPHIKQETSASISDQVMINPTPPSITEQRIVHHKTEVVTENTINHNKDNLEVLPQAPLESANNNIKDNIMGTTNDRQTLSEVSFTGKPNTLTNNFNEQEAGPKQLNTTAVNVEKETSADNVIKYVPTTYSDTTGKITPTKFATVSINTGYGESNNNNFPKKSTTTVVHNEKQTSEPKNVYTNQFQTETAQISGNESEVRAFGSSINAPTQASDPVKIIPTTSEKTATLLTDFINGEKNQIFNFVPVLAADQTIRSSQTINDNIVNDVPRPEKTKTTEGTHSSIVSSKVYQNNEKKRQQPKVKNVIERDVVNSNQSPKTLASADDNMALRNYAAEAVNLAPFDSLSSTKSGCCEEKNKMPTEKPDDEEETINDNKVNSITSSSESIIVTTESVEGGKIGNSQHLVQINNKYETLTSKPTRTLKTSTRPVHVDNLKNIQQLPVVYEVSTRSTVSSTSLTPSSDINSLHPATTKPITNNFVCKFNQRGRFADNHDCHKFYICIGRPQPLEGICPIFTVFSEIRKQCTKNLSHCVRNNQFQCVSEGRFSDFLNDNIYYICVKNKLSTFIRFKLRCQNGYHLNKTSVRCVLNTESSQSISDISKSISEQSAPLKLEDKRQDISTKKFECNEEGRFADPNNCRVYFICKKNSKSGYLRKKKKCDSDESFHKDKKKCVDAESYECK